MSVQQQIVGANAASPSNSEVNANSVCLFICHQPTGHTAHACTETLCNSTAVHSVKYIDLHLKNG